MILGSSKKLQFLEFMIGILGVHDWNSWSSWEFLEFMISTNPKKNILDFMNAGWKNTWKQ